ncbi:MAG: hypothetical protein Ct9H300mP19_02940 [Dehalococcoidia bacterium]|nr:MAG: hypothetical protein Ct9H300mP19_02940 [Dehalococcoidia bacterium]
MNPKATAKPCAIKEWGGRVNKWTRNAETGEKVMISIANASLIRDTLDYDIDGVVIKINSLAYKNASAMWAEIPVGYRFKFPLNVRNHT